MKNSLISILVLTTLIPSLAFAQIQSTTESEVDTGGNSVESGGTIKTGASASSVKTTNVIDDAGASTKIEVRTEANGSVKTETIEKQVFRVPDVRVSASSTIEKPSIQKTVSEGKITVTVGGATSTATPFWVRPFVEIRILVQKLFSFWSLF